MELFISILGDIILMSLFVYICRRTKKINHEVHEINERTKTCTYNRIQGE